MLTYIQLEFQFRDGSSLTQIVESTPELITALTTRRLHNIKVGIVDKVPTISGVNLRSHEGDYPDAENKGKQ